MLTTKQRERFESVCMVLRDDLLDSHDELIKMRLQLRFDHLHPSATFFAALRYVLQNAVSEARELRAQLSAKIKPGESPLHFGHTIAAAAHVLNRDYNADLSEEFIMEIIGDALRASPNYGHIIYEWDKASPRHSNVLELLTEMEPLLDVDTRGHARNTRAPTFGNDESGAAWNPQRSINKVDADHDAEYNEYYDQRFQELERNAQATTKWLENMDESLTKIVAKVEREEYEPKKKPSYRDAAKPRNNRGGGRSSGARASRDSSRRRKARSGYKQQKITRGHTPAGDLADAETVPPGAHIQIAREKAKEHGLDAVETAAIMLWTEKGYLKIDGKFVEPLILFCQNCRKTGHNMLQCPAPDISRHQLKLEASRGQKSFTRLAREMLNMHFSEYNENSNASD